MSNPRWLPNQSPQHFVSGLQKGPAERGHVIKRQKSSKSVKFFDTFRQSSRRAKNVKKIFKKRQKVFRHFSTIFARHHFFQPLLGGSDLVQNQNSTESSRPRVPCASAFLGLCFEALGVKNCQHMSSVGRKRVARRSLLGQNHSRIIFCANAVSIFWGASCLRKNAAMSILKCFGLPFRTQINPRSSRQISCPACLQQAKEITPTSFCRVCRDSSLQRMLTNGWPTEQAKSQFDPQVYARLPPEWALGDKFFGHCELQCEECGEV